MFEKDSFVNICERVRFRGDTCKTYHKPDASLRLKEFAEKMRSQGLRITPTLTPKLHEVLSNTTKALKLSLEPEAYVVADPISNAYAPIFGIQNRPLLVLTSGIVELLSPLELEFVIGHELGHLGLGHPGMAEKEQFQSELEALKKLSVSRASEISADRLGLIATKSLTIAANVKIKLASGLTSNHIRPDIHAFLDQIEHKAEWISHEWELYQLHPSLPMRLWALIQFSKTVEYAQLSQQGASGISLEEADSQIVARLAELGDGKLTKMEQRNFDLMVTWLGTALVFDDEIIEEHEQKLLESLIGKDLTKKALNFAKDYGLKLVLEKLRDSLERLDLNEVRVKNKLKSTYETFVKHVNVLEDHPKAYEIVKSFL